MPPRTKAVGKQADVPTLVAAAPVRTAASPPRIIKQPFALVGGVKVVITGPEGVVKWESTQESLVIWTGEATPAANSRPASARRAPAARQPQPSGDPTEPGGTIEESLPGDDEVAERKGRQIEAETFDFLAKGQKAMLSRQQNE